VPLTIKIIANCTFWPSAGGIKIHLSEAALNWNLIPITPKGTPQATVDKLSNAVAKVVALPEVRERLTVMGLTVGYMTPSQLASREQAYAKTWARIIADSGFKAQ